jgi:hypothetical protein
VGTALEKGSEAEIFASLLKWIHYVTFEVKPILSVDQVISAINKAAAESKPK